MIVALPKNRKMCIAVLGLIFIALGGAGLLLAQRQPARQVIRISSDGAYLGIEMADVTTEVLAKYKLSGETGVIVRSVEKGSPAEAAGLQENDVILEYAGMPVFSSSALARLVQETPVNRTVTLLVSRDGKKITLAAKLGEREGAPALTRRFELLPPDNLGRFFGQPGNGFFQSVPRSGSRALNLLSDRPQLGVTVEPLTDQMASFLGVPGKKGIMVNSVTPGSPAASALKAGDVILSMDGKPLSEPSDLTQALAGKTAGSKVELKIIRDKKEITVAVEFAKSATAQRGIIL
jgi:serine protease Do